MNRFFNDHWIESRYSWLRDEHLRLQGGAIGAHYLRCVGAAYAEFISTGSQRDRFRTWVGIVTLSQWLCQLRAGR